MAETKLLNGTVTVRPDDRGEFDELFAKNCSVHLEMMDDKTLWIGIDVEGQEDPVHVWVSARGKLKITADEA